jgi:hypothetical protein
MVGIKFKGKFYDGHSYHSINFGVIDTWSIHEKTKELKVIFSPSFIKMMLGKGFFKYVNFSEFKQLRSSLATRLYEILIKSYHGRDTWSIEASLLAKKIPMKERYPAHIIPKIRTAVSRINRSTSVQFEFSTQIGEKGQSLLVFRKLPTEQTVLQPRASHNERNVVVIPETEDIRALVDLLSIEHRNKRSILEMIVNAYETYGLAYVSRNIRYTNKNATKSYRAYLQKALQVDYGRELEEDEAAQRRAISERSRQVDEEIAKQAEIARLRQLEEDARDRAKTYLATLTDDQRQSLEIEVIAALNSEMQALVRGKRLGWRVMLNQAMAKAATIRLEQMKDKDAAPAATVETPE